MKRKKILFLSPDEVVLERAFFSVCPPIDRQVIMKAEMPWESRFIAFYTTMIKVDDEYRLYYTCRDTSGFGSLCLATSRDGIHFERPNLGLREYHGSRNNNMLNIDSLEGNVIYSPNAPHEERFIYLAHTYPEGFYLHTSPDGIHWKKQDTVLLERFCDSQNIVIRNPEKQDEYLMYARGWSPCGENGSMMRTVVRIEWPDIHTPLACSKHKMPYKWSHNLPPFSSEEEIVMSCDYSDHPRSDVYTNSVELYEGYYISFPSIYWHELSPEEGGKYANNGDIEVMCSGSRDGHRFYRYDRTPYIRNEIGGRFASRMAFIGPGILKENGVLRQYGTIFRTRHGETPERDMCADGSIVAYDQRIDGFVCACFPSMGGRITTQPWEKQGDVLLINADCGVTGTLSFALSDACGRILPGFDFDDMTTLHVNSISYPLHWKGGCVPTEDIIRVLINGKNARLFSIAWGNL